MTTQRILSTHEPATGTLEIRTAYGEPRVLLKLTSKALKGSTGLALATKIREAVAQAEVHGFQAGIEHAHRAVRRTMIETERT